MTPTPPPEALSDPHTENVPRRGVIGVLAGDLEDRNRIGQELQDRYGRNYDMAIWMTPEAALGVLRELNAGDAHVVLLVACQRRADDGLDFLRDAGSIHPQAKRAIAIRWGDFEA